MGSKSKIEWTDATWNPIRGCTRVSQGCVHCYAETLTARFAKPGLWGEGIAVSTPSGARWTGKLQLVEKHLEDPLRWREPRKIFVNSLSDLFHEKLPGGVIDRIFSVMAQAPHHVFQILTKRPKRMREYLSDSALPSGLEALAGVDVKGRWPLPNVWLGVSAEDQAAADERVPLLLETPAAVRFISAEPLLGPLQLGHWLCEEGYDGITADGLPRLIPPLDWIIVGGESGPGARPMHPVWVRSIRDQCQVDGVAFFFKQWGEHKPGLPTTDPASQSMHRVGKKSAGRELDGRTWDEMPEAADAST